MKTLYDIANDNDLLMQIAIVVMAVALLAFLANIYFHVIRSDKFDNEIEWRYQSLDGLLTIVMSLSSELKALDHDVAFTPHKLELTFLLRLSKTLAHDIRSIRAYDLDQVKRRGIANVGPMINAMDKFERRLKDIEDKKAALESKLRVTAEA